MSTELREVELVDDETVANLSRAVVMAALVGALAYVSFPYPLSPAPITLQVLGVFLAGLLLGAKWGGFAVVVYLLAGAVGAPVFEGGGAGLGAFFGPTGGYLLGFPIAAALVGLIAHGRGAPVSPDALSIRRAVAGMVVGTVVIYALGVPVLGYYLEMSLREAVFIGAVVFVPAEIVKMAAAITILKSDRLAAA